MRDVFGPNYNPLHNTINPTWNQSQQLSQLNQLNSQFVKQANPQTVPAARTWASALVGQNVHGAEQKFLDFLGIKDWETTWEKPEYSQLATRVNEQIGKDGGKITPRSFRILVEGQAEILAERIQQNRPDIIIDSKSVARQTADKLSKHIPEEFFKGSEEVRKDIVAYLAAEMGIPVPQARQALAVRSVSHSSPVVETSLSPNLTDEMHDVATLAEGAADRLNQNADPVQVKSEIEAVILKYQKLQLPSRFTEAMAKRDGAKFEALMATTNRLEKAMTRLGDVLREKLGPLDRMPADQRPAEYTSLNALLDRFSDTISGKQSQPIQTFHGYGLDVKADHSYLNRAGKQIDFNAEDKAQIILRASDGLKKITAMKVSVDSVSSECHAAMLEELKGDLKPGSFEWESLRAGGMDPQSVLNGAQDGQPKAVLEAYVQGAGILHLKSLLVIQENGFNVLAEIAKKDPTLVKLFAEIVTPELAYLLEGGEGKSSGGGGRASGAAMPTQTYAYNAPTILDYQSLKTSTLFAMVIGRSDENFFTSWIKHLEEQAIVDKAGFKQFVANLEKMKKEFELALAKADSVKVQGTLQSGVTQLTSLIARLTPMLPNQGGNKSSYSDDAPARVAAVTEFFEQKDLNRRAQSDALRSSVLFNSNRAV